MSIFVVGIIADDDPNDAVDGCISMLGNGFFALLMGEMFGISLKLQEEKGAAA
ncbi:MAG: hypothetical protein IJV38_06185 [Prevotella sp.]|nr:hypothetical protein [Prevotella sp.]